MMHHVSIIPRVAISFNCKTASFEGCLSPPPPGQIEPIPDVLQSVIDHLVQWRLIPETKRPNSCIINFFDEVFSHQLSLFRLSQIVDACLLTSVVQDEHSQPYFKPPHLDIPVSTLVLSETEMAFGKFLVADNHGSYKGSLSLSLKDG